MTEPVVDPALFRLRAFESEWIERFSRPLRKRTRRHRARLLLNSVLLAEAERWISIGQRVGYFAEASLAAMPDKEEFDETLYFDDGADQLMTDPRMFAYDLNVAREDLSYAREELLLLLHFADEAEWELGLRQASALAEELERRPWLTLPPQEVDALAWCLDGAELEASTDLPSPADWRIRTLRSEAAAARWNAIGEVRTAIAATMHRLDNDENTPAELRVAAEMQMRREGTVTPDADPFYERMAWEKWRD
jgi:hypothetical protein